MIIPPTIAKIYNMIAPHLTKRQLLFSVGCKLKRNTENVSATFAVSPAKSAKSVAAALSRRIK
jgi:hypothetical protein